MSDTFIKLGIKPGVIIQFKVKGRVNSGIYPLNGQGCVEIITGNSVLLRTSSGYVVTIHDYEVVCGDVVLNIV